MKIRTLSFIRMNFQNWMKRTADAEKLSSQQKNPRNVRNAGQKILNKIQMFLILGSHPANGPLPRSDILIQKISKLFILRTLWKPAGVFFFSGWRAWLCSENTEPEKRLLKRSICMGSCAVKTANKMWNATRFVLMNIKEAPLKKITYTADQKKALKKLDEITQKTSKDLDELKFHHAAESLYHFFWHYYADKIIEEAKKDLGCGDKNKAESAKALLLKFHSTLLKLLHPFMPHITEKIWELVPRENPKMLIIEEWPKSSRK